MPDTYIDVGPMALSKDLTKVPARYAKDAKQIMRDAAIKAIRAAKGFTPDKGSNTKGFHFDVTLDEIVLGTYKGQPSVTCKANGILANYPQKTLVAKTLIGSATLAGGTSDQDVKDCIKAVVEAIVNEKLIPTLRKLLNP
jgi:hypothetical protein